MASREYLPPVPLSPTFYADLNGPIRPLDLAVAYTDFYNMYQREQQNTRAVGNIKQVFETSEMDRAEDDETNNPALPRLQRIVGKNIITGLNDPLNQIIRYLYPDQQGKLAAFEDIFRYACIIPNPGETNRIGKFDKIVNPHVRAAYRYFASTECLRSMAKLAGNPNMVRPKSTEVEIKPNTKKARPRNIFRDTKEQLEMEASLREGASTFFAEIYVSSIEKLLELGVADPYNDADDLRLSMIPLLPDLLQTINHPETPYIRFRLAMDFIWSVLKIPSFNQKKDLIKYICDINLYHLEQEYLKNMATYNEQLGNSQKKNLKTTPPPPPYHPTDYQVTRIVLEKLKSEL